MNKLCGYMQDYSRTRLLDRIGELEAKTTELSCLLTELQIENADLKAAIQKKMTREEGYLKGFLENCGFNVATVNRCLKLFREED